ncbi:MAG: tail fiber domain-containing protein [Bacteroidota bacterium]
MKKCFFFIATLLCLFVIEMNAQVRATPDRLGVGTENPDEKLEVEGSGTVTRVGVTTTTEHNATFRAKTPNSDFGWYSGGNANVFRLYDFNTDLDRMTITSDGNVGIGIVPMYKLDVFGDIMFRNRALISDAVVNSSTSNIDHIWHDDINGDGAGGKWNFVSDDAYKAPGNAQLRAGSVYMGSENQDNYFAGNIEVGGDDVSLIGKVYIENRDRRYSIFTQNFGPANTIATRYGMYASATTSASSNTGNHYGTFGFASANSTCYGIYGHTEGFANTSINNYGVYGYAFTGNSRKYGVYGIAEGFGPSNYGVYGTASSADMNFAGYFNGTLAYTGALLFASDKKFKQNVRQMNSALNKVLKLQPKTYHFEKHAHINFPEEKQFGFIAQELQEEFPELVIQNLHPHFGKEGEHTGETKYLSVNYINLIPVLTKAIQEQQIIIEEKEDKIVALEKRMEALDQLMQTVLKQIENRASIIQQSTLHQKAYLEQNQPNPFSEDTTIKYFIPSTAKQAILKVFTTEGRLIESLDLDLQATDITLNNASLPAGNYIYTLIVDGVQMDSKTMLLTK